MKMNLTIMMLLVILQLGAQTSVTPVVCSSGKFYVRVTFTDEYTDPHPVSSVICPDGIHFNTEESQHLGCRMELFSDPGCIMPVPVDPRFFEYQDVITGSHGTRPDPSFMYIPDCSDTVPASSEYKDNWRMDHYLVTRTICQWQCNAGYQCSTSGPGVPTNYNIIINCCFGPVALVVRLLEFTGVRDGIQNELRWKLENSHDLLLLAIERSFDGIQFSTVFTTADLQVNKWKDLVSQTAYYRLRISNTNGSLLLSPVVVLRTDPPPGRILVAPSPFRDLLQVTVKASRSHTVLFTLFTATGKTVFQAERTLQRGSNQFPFFLPQLPPGMYVLNLQSAEGPASLQLVKL